MTKITGQRADNHCLASTPVASLDERISRGSVRPRFAVSLSKHGNSRVQPCLENSVPKLILSLTILIVAISGVSGYLNFRTQKKQLEETMILGADQLSRSITGATWHAMLDDDRRAAYEIMRVIADKQGIDRIRMFNREGRLVFSTDGKEQPGVTSLSNEVCASCHTQGRDPPQTGRGLSGALCHFPGWREDHQHGGAHLQRAFVQQRQLPRAPRRRPRC